MSEQTYTIAELIREFEITRAPSPTKIRADLPRRECNACTTSATVASQTGAARQAARAVAGGDSRVIEDVRHDPRRKLQLLALPRSAGLRQAMLDQQRRFIGRAGRIDRLRAGNDGCWRAMPRRHD